MKDMMTEAGKLIAYILRHRPDEFGLAIDPHGWVDVNGLVNAVKTQYPFDLAALEAIVATDKKKRYSFSDDKSRIRANQGHSIPVDVEMPEAVPPDILYHGTGAKYVDGILRQGLLPKSRLHVHLSADFDTARTVGARHGEPVVFRVGAKAMHEAGHVFWLSENGVWLVKAVPPEYLRIIEQGE